MPLFGVGEPSSGAALAEPLGDLIARVRAEWQPLLQAWVQSAPGQTLLAHVAVRQAAGATIYPRQVFRAMEALSPRDVRVVILGQDPYHGPGQAEGLAFSVPPGQKLPPSLRNIFTELSRDMQVPMPDHGHLGAWVAQGVLLLNTVLTVEDGSPASHAKKGWEALTGAIIAHLAREDSPKVFLLWGAHAQAWGGVIEATGRGHLLLTANHPSPLSARRPPQPFIGCGHFSAVNRFLGAQHGAAAVIEWALPALSGV